MKKKINYQITDSVDKLQIVLDTVREAQKSLPHILRNRWIRSFWPPLLLPINREYHLQKWRLKRQRWV